MVFRWPRFIDGAFEFNGLNDEVRMIGVFHPNVLVFPVFVFLFLDFDRGMLIGNIHDIDQQSRVLALATNRKREVFDSSPENIFL